MNVLTFCLEEGEKEKEILFTLRRMVNAGFTGRDQARVREHIEELRREGVPAPDSTPTAYEVISRLIYLDDEIEVVGDKTSGEAEFVLLCGEKGIHVGVGSDHTDRELESISIIKSKQICPNIISTHLWDLQTIRGDWDRIMLRSWVKDEKGKKILYQEAALSTMMTPEDLMDFVKSRMDDRSLEGVALFSGTVPILTEKMIFSPYFETELFNPRTGRRLNCAYRIRTLNYLGG